MILHDRHNELQQLDTRQLRAMPPLLMGWLNHHDPSAYLKYMLERLPTQPTSRVQELLPHRRR
jgi:IS66 C-terminal element